MQSPPTGSSGQSRHRIITRSVLALLIAMLLFSWVRLYHNPEGDFTNHYAFAGRILQHQFIYADGLDRVYPPFWAVVHVPFHLVGVDAAEMILFPFGVASMVLLVLILKKLADPYWPLSGDELFASTALAILLAAPVLHRDLAEMGVNSFLVMISWWGVRQWIERRPIRGAVAIGLAAALKCTPALFIAYFALKRQYKFAVVATIAALLFSLSPIFVLGPGEFVRVERFWLGMLHRTATQPDPSRSVLGEDIPNNVSLRPALARYLMNLPYGHKGRPETSPDDDGPLAPREPLYLQFFNFSPIVAGRIVKLIFLALAAIIAIRMHKPADYPSDPAILWECAAISLAILLFSPVTWGQHCVGALPALYLMFRAKFAGEKLPRIASIALIAFFVIFCLLIRGLLTKRISLLLDSYHIRTLGIFLLLIGTLACRSLRGARQN